MITFNVFCLILLMVMNLCRHKPVHMEESHQVMVQQPISSHHENRKNLCDISVVPTVIIHQITVEMFGKNSFSRFIATRRSLIVFFRKHQARKHPTSESKVVKIIRQDSEMNNNTFEDDDDDNSNQNLQLTNKSKPNKKSDKSLLPQPTPMPILSNFAPVRVFQCSACHQQGTYKWVVERHIRAKHPEQGNVHVIELPAELSVKLQKITSPLKRYRCSLCPLQSKHSWVVVRVRMKIFFFVFSKGGICVSVF